MTGTVNLYKVVLWSLKINTIIKKVAIAISCPEQLSVNSWSTFKYSAVHFYCSILPTLHYSFLFRDRDAFNIKAVKVKYSIQLREKTGKSFTKILIKYMNRDLML